MIQFMEFVVTNLHFEWWAHIHPLWFLLMRAWHGTCGRWIRPSGFIRPPRLRGARLLFFWGGGTGAARKPPNPLFERSTPPIFVCSPLPPPLLLTSFSPFFTSSSALRLFLFPPPRLGFLPSSLLLLATYSSSAMSLLFYPTSFSSSFPTFFTSALHVPSSSSLRDALCHPPLFSTSPFFQSVPPPSSPFSTHPSWRTPPPLLLHALSSTKPSSSSVLGRTSPPPSKKLPPCFLPPLCFFEGPPFFEKATPPLQRSLPPSSKKNRPLPIPHLPHRLVESLGPFPSCMLARSHPPSSLLRRTPPGFSNMPPSPLLQSSPWFKEEPCPFPTRPPLSNPLPPSSASGWGRPWPRLTKWPPLPLQRTLLLQQVGDPYPIGPVSVSLWWNQRITDSSIFQ